MELYPTAEEVVLPNGMKPPPITSTTGRRLTHLETSTLKNGARNTVPQSSGEAAGHRKMSPASVSSTVGSSHYDNYGFQVTREEKAAEDYYNRVSPLYTLDTLRKWEALLGSAAWDSTSQMKKKKLCRAGIPQPCRAQAWERLLFDDYCTPAVKRGMSDSAMYDRLSSVPLTPEEKENEIYRDLDRTFPTHRLFHDGIGNNGVGQLALRRMLRAYANFNPKVGYCQGMGFVAATLWIQLQDEQKAFWALVSLMDNDLHNLKRLYEPGFPQLQCCFFVLKKLVDKLLPKVGQKMDSYGIEFSFFSTHWFLTVFSYYLNFRLVCHIWDMFLCEGWKPVYRVALALLKMEESRLLSAVNETDFLLLLKMVQESKDPALLLETALSIKFKTAKVRKYSEQYWASQK